MAKALFLDRDGVINVDHAYVSHINDFEFIDEIFQLCRIAVEKGYLLIVVTNQAGIGRGFYSDADFHVLNNWMKLQFEREQCALTAVYYCPTHPIHGVGDYRIESDFRKPNPGMLFQAARDHNIDLLASIIIGDKCSDMLAGKLSNIGTRLLYNQCEICEDETVVRINALHEAIRYL